MKGTGLRQAIVQGVLSEKLYSGTPKDVAYSIAGDVSMLRGYTESLAYESQDDSLTILIQAKDRLRELERVFQLAFENASEAEVLIWSMLRLPMYEAKSEFGEISWRPYTRKEASQELRTTWGMRYPYHKVGLIAGDMDIRLHETLQKQRMLV